MSLRPGDMGVLDNLAAHQGDAVERLIRQAGAELRSLPAYSPDLNPLETCSARSSRLVLGKPRNPAWMTRQPVPGCGLRLASEFLDNRPAILRSASDLPQLSGQFNLVATAPGRLTTSVINPLDLQLPATSLL